LRDGSWVDARAACAVGDESADEVHAVPDADAGGVCGGCIAGADAKVWERLWLAFVAGAASGERDCYSLSLVSVL
jgi:hypothetical protein